MSALINVLDNLTPKQIGENGHVEYTWSNDIREKILQFSFQLTRTDKDNLKKLQEILNTILTQLKHKIDNSQIIEREISKAFLSVLYRMIGHTRDIVEGKGEYTLTYMMIYTWYNYYPDLSLFALKCLVELEDNHTHPYGSWKDIKYFCEYCRKESNNIEHPLINYGVNLLNSQIKKDYESYNNNNINNNNNNVNDNNISLAAKWSPREKSMYSWLYQKFAVNYFNEYIFTANNNGSYTKAVLKCKTEYRKIISTLNKQLDTLQIKQCSKIWSKIDFNHVTSISLLKQKQAFLNVDKSKMVRYPDDLDRITCADNFKNHIQKAIKGEIEINGKRVGMADFTKQALNLINHDKHQPESPGYIEAQLLNSQWRDNSKQNAALGKMIAMVDVSGSMDGDPLYAAISLGIRIAEKSLLGKRVLTFSRRPTWVNLDSYDDFVTQVEVLKTAPWGTNTNFNAALNMILDAIIQSKLEPVDVQDMILVILSDMQIDQADYSNDTMYESMLKKYEETGIRVHGKPYKPPHILFWNLRSTDGFPTLSNQANTSMMSGFSPVLLNLFCEQGVDALQSCTPWSLLEKTLENKRYKILSDKFSEILM